MIYVCIQIFMLFVSDKSINQTINHSSIQFQYINQLISQVINELVTYISIDLINQICLMQTSIRYIPINP